MAHNRISASIFEHTAPRRFADVIGTFRSGTQIGNKPLSLSAWRLTTGDPAVADAIAVLYGGTPQAWTTTTEESLEVFTTATKLNIELSGPASIQAGFALWGRNGLIHTCDGEVTSDGTPCPQAGKSLAERKEAARAGVGCAPSIMMTFALKDADPDSAILTDGLFRFRSSSWTLAAEIDAVQDALDAATPPVAATLALVPVDYTTKKGRHVEYTKPEIVIL